MVSCETCGQCIICKFVIDMLALQWRYNERDGVSDHQAHDCLLNRLSRRRSNKTSKLRVTGLCVESSPVTGELPAQRASNAVKVSIWWRHHCLLPRVIHDNDWSPTKCVYIHLFPVTSAIVTSVTVFHRNIDNIWVTAHIEFQKKSPQN